MIKLSILLASVGLLFSVTTQAQMTKKPQETRTSYKAKASTIDAQEVAFLYGTMVVFQQNSQEVVKISFDDIVQRMGPNKAALKLTEQLSAHRFSSMGEALNVLSSHGLNVYQTWTQEGSRTGTEVHFLLRMNVGKLLPVSPWVEKRTVEEGAKEKAKKK